MSVDIRLDNIIVESSSSPHDDIPDDSKILAQLIIKDDILWETLPTGKEDNQHLWKLPINRTIPDCIRYSIGIVRVSAREGTRLLGLTETSRISILGSIMEGKKGLSLQIMNVTDDGPSLKLRAEFTPALKSGSRTTTSQSSSIENQDSLIEYNSLKIDLIWPRLQEIHETVQTSNSSTVLPEVSVMYERILLLPRNDERKSKWLNLLGDIYKKLYDNLEDKDNSILTQAICAYRDATRLRVNDDINVTHWSNLGAALLCRFERLGHASDIDKSIAVLQEAIQLTPEGHPDKPSLFKRLGKSCFVRYEHFDDISDFFQFILHVIPLLSETDRVATLSDLQASSFGNLSDKPTVLDMVGMTLHLRFEKHGDLNDLNHSIRSHEEALQLTPDGHSEKPSRLNNLVNSLLSRFQQLNDLNDLNQAITAQEKAIQISPEDNSDKATLLNNLGILRLRRFERLGEVDDLNQSITMKEQAIQLIPKGDPNRPSLSSNLGNAFLKRFTLLGDLNDFDKSIIMHEEAVQLTSEDHPDRFYLLKNLSNSLSNRFERLGNVDDLNQAITMQEKTIQLIPMSHPNKSSVLKDLSNSFFKRFSRFGNLSDLNHSIMLVEEAIRITPKGHPEKPTFLNELGGFLLGRFLRLGDIGDINQSITMREEALELSPNGHPQKPSWMNDLGSSLLVRFQGLGDLADIQRAIIWQEKSIQLIPKNHSNKRTMLSNLSMSLSLRFERSNDLSDLARSIAVSEEVVQLTPEGHPGEGSALMGLGVLLIHRFERLDDLNDLYRAIKIQEKAVQLTPEEHPAKFRYLNGLGNSLSRRFERLGDLSGLNLSIKMSEDAIQLMPEGHPEKPNLLCNLGSSLSHRFKRLYDRQDRIYAIHCYSSAALASTGRPAVKFRASYEWARLEAQSDNSSTLKAYSNALALLPQIAWLGSSVQDRHFYIREAGSIVRHAVVAAIKDDNVATAVEWLEQGRSVIWGQLLQLRLPIDDLKSSHPELAEQLLSLSSKLEGANIAQSSMSVASPTPNEALDYHHIAHEREILINRIRQLSGFEYFLSPKPLSELAKAARLGPVVMLNAGESQCDALILVPGVSDNALHIPLPDISLIEAEALHEILKHLIEGQIPTIDRLTVSSKDDNRLERLNIILTPQGNNKSFEERLEEMFRDLLSLIWHRIVKPIIQGLALKTDNPCRIWWCPNGPFSFLPLHAAGDYSLNAVVGSKLTDYGISSYIPSLTSLVQRLDSMQTVSNVPRLLVVTQPSANGQAFIKGTLQELKLIEGQTKKKNIPMVSLRPYYATVSRVKEEMKYASWAHFACHGVQNSKTPTESALLLAGSERLTLSEIIGMKMPPKDLAFLSACQTATGNESLSDEAVHLAAGMLSAGYQGVIATMWSISDSHAPAVANDVYAYLFNNGKPDSAKAAEALHHAVKNLQRKSVSPLVWSPFIHMGL